MKAERLYNTSYGLVNPLLRDVRGACFTGSPNKLTGSVGLTGRSVDFYDGDSRGRPEWRNWYTHQTQNLARFTPHESSSLSSGTISAKQQEPTNRDSPKGSSAHELSARISLVMRVTIGQINTTNGDYEGNTARIIGAIERARKDRADVVVFPEVTIQGYTSLDWFLDPDVIRSALNCLNRIIEATDGLTAIVGTVRPSDQATGRKLYNSAAVIRDKTLLGFADKTLLPEYDVFDDPRYFEPAHERRLFSVDDYKLGVPICEDFWNDKTFWKQRLYANDPADELIEMAPTF